MLNEISHINVVRWCVRGNTCCLRPTSGAPQKTAFSVVFDDAKLLSETLIIIACMLSQFAPLDQEVSRLDASMSIRDNFLRLNPGSEEYVCRAALARIRFRADAALQIVDTLSGGQKLLAGLACVLGHRAPPLLLLDEPTNHLDIDAIEAIEAGLRAYDVAMLVISHDTAFLKDTWRDANA